MTKIKADVLESAVSHKEKSRSLISASTYNIADIFANVNPADKHFLKYVPDGFLSNEQKAAKESALKEDRDRIKKYARKESKDRSFQLRTASETEATPMEVSAKDVAKVVKNGKGSIGRRDLELRVSQELE